ncbi:hypothetical protein CYMTET_21201, partial [Cymbomonas tetramitiformis]
MPGCVMNPERDALPTTTPDRLPSGPDAPHTPATQVALPPSVRPSAVTRPPRPAAGPLRLGRNDITSMLRSAKNKQAQRTVDNSALWKALPGDGREEMLANTEVQEEGAPPMGDARSEEGGEGDAALFERFEGPTARSVGTPGEGLDMQSVSSLDFVGENGDVLEERSLRSSQGELGEVAADEQADGKGWGKVRKSVPVRRGATRLVSFPEHVLQQAAQFREGLKRMGQLVEHGGGGDGEGEEEEPPQAESPGEELRALEERFVSGLEAERDGIELATWDPQRAAERLSSIPPRTAAATLAAMHPQTAANVLTAMDRQMAGAVLSAVGDSEKAAAILAVSHSKAAAMWMGSAPEDGSEAMHKHLIAVEAQPRAGILSGMTKEAAQGHLAAMSTAEAGAMLQLMPHSAAGAALSDDPEVAAAQLAAMSAGAASRVLATKDPESQVAVLAAAPWKASKNWLQELDVAAVAEHLANMQPPSEAASHLKGMRPAKAAAVLAAQEPNVSGAILSSMGAAASVAVLAVMDPAAAGRTLAGMDAEGGKTAAVLAQVYADARDEAKAAGKLASMPAEAAAMVLRQMEPAKAAAMLRITSPHTAAGWLGAVAPEEAAALLDGAGVDTAAAVLLVMPAEAAAAIVQISPAGEAQLARMNPLSRGAVLGHCAPAEAARLLVGGAGGSSQEAAEQLQGMGPEAAAKVLAAEAPAAAAAQLALMPAGEAAAALDEMELEAMLATIAAIRDRRAAKEILAELPPASSAQLLAAMPTEEAAVLLSMSDPEVAAAQLSAMDPDAGHAIMKGLKEHDASVAQLASSLLSKLPGDVEQQLDQIAAENPHAAELKAMLRDVDRASQGRQDDGNGGGAGEGSVGGAAEQKSKKRRKEGGHREDEQGKYRFDGTEAEPAGPIPVMERAVTLEFVHNVYAYLARKLGYKAEIMSTAQVISELVVPLTRPHACSFVEFMARHAPGELKASLLRRRQGVWHGRASSLVSHPWGGKHRLLVEALEGVPPRPPPHGSRLGAAPEPHLFWISAFASNLHGPELQPVLMPSASATAPPPAQGATPQSIASAVLKEAGHVMLVWDDWNSPACCLRTWCMYEAWQALSAGVRLSLALTDSGQAEVHVASLARRKPRNLQTQAEEELVQQLQHLVVTVDLANATTTVRAEGKAMSREMGGGASPEHLQQAGRLLMESLTWRFRLAAIAPCLREVLVERQELTVLVLLAPNSTERDLFFSL